MNDDANVTDFPIGGRNDLNREQALSWAVRQMRRDFLSQPPKVQAETIARVKVILASTRHPSALATLAPLVYGVRR